MEDENCVGETLCDLTKPRIVPYKNAWKPHQNSFLVRFEARSRERIAVLLDKVACNRPQRQNYQVVCMKTQDELYQKVRLTPRVPRVC